jgi:hypothetical protein
LPALFAEPPGLDAERFGLEKKGFKRVLKKIFSSEIEELISATARRRGVASL